MTDVKFKIDGSKIDEVLDWDSIEIIENRDMPKMKRVCAFFVVDEKGAPVPYDAALKMLGKVKLKDINPLMDTFFKIWAGNAVNPTTGSESKEPLPKAEVPQSGGSN